MNKIEADEYTSKLISTTYISFDEFIHDIDTEYTKTNVNTEGSIFRSFFDDRVLAEFELTNENTRFVFSFGGGGPNAFFPHIFTNTTLNPVRNDGHESEVSTIVIIAFDETFHDSSISVAFQLSIVNHLRTLKPNQLNVQVIIVFICENIPPCTDKSIVRYNTYLLQTRDDATFETMRPCDVSGSFFDKLVHLVQEINRHTFSLYIHNDAWFDTTLPFGKTTKVTRIQQFGSNFETLSVIPMILHTYFNKDNVFMIRYYGIRIAQIIPFFSREAIHLYDADFTNATNAVVVGLRGGRRSTRRRAQRRRSSRHRGKRT